MEHSYGTIDYNTFLVFSSVLEHSALFWLPKELGGLGNFDKNQYKDETHLPAAALYFSNKCLDDTLLADGTSAGTGFIVGATLAGVSGGTLGVPFLIGVAIESGVSSGMSYFKCR